MIATSTRPGRKILQSSIAAPVALLAVPLALLVVVFFAPVARMFWQSLWGANGFTLGNYQKLFSVPSYTNSLFWTFELAIAVSLVSVLVAYPIAYAMANGSRNLRALLLVCAILPLWTSSLPRTFAWVQILGARGVVNWVLMGLGITDEPLSLLYNHFAVYVASIHDKTPYMVLCLYGAMVNIDRNVVRTAATLGATRSRAFLLTYAPQTMPGLAAGVVLVLINSLGLYTTPIVLGGSTTQPFVVHVQRSMNQLLDWGLAATLGTFLVIVTFAFYLLLGRYLGLNANASEQSESGAVTSYRLLSFADRWLFWARRKRIKVPAGRRAANPLPAMSTFVAVALGLVLAFPVLLIVVLAFSSSYTVLFPPPGFSFHLFGLYFGSPEWMSATMTSFVIAFFTAVLTTLLAVPAALGLRKMHGTWRAIMLGVILVPMMVPTVVYGAAAYMQFVGNPFLSRAAILVLTHTVLALPPTLLLVMAGTHGLDKRLEDAAASLGASPWRCFRHVTLPLITPAAAGGALVAFLTGLEELGIAIFVANNNTMTLPKRMLDAVLVDLDPRPTAAAAFLVIVSLVLLLVVHLLQRRSLVSRI